MKTQTQCREPGPHPSPPFTQDPAGQVALGVPAAGGRGPSYCGSTSASPHLGPTGLSWVSGSPKGPAQGTLPV